jgi:hypothetical protein
MKRSVQHSYIGPRDVRPIVMDASDVHNYRDLERVGIIFDGGPFANINRMATLMGAMDANDVAVSYTPLAPLYSQGVSVPVQYLQAWQPGFVHAATAPRLIDELVGITTAGSFEDEEIVQGSLEHLGAATLYTDHGNIPLASFTNEFERRTIVRTELGFAVSNLEDLRTARIKISVAAEKRASVDNALEIQRNRTGFFGYNGGSNRTFGLLNDPALPAYVSLPTGDAGSSLWSEKTSPEIINDIIMMLNTLQARSKGLIDVRKTPITLALPNSVSQYLSNFLTIQNVIGTQSVKQWLNSEYPNVRVVFVPEFDDANGGASAVYAYAEKVSDGSSTDNGETFAQFVPARFITVGVERNAKGYVEDFACATAGVMLKRPFAVARYTGA